MKAASYSNNRYHSFNFKANDLAQVKKPGGNIEWLVAENSLNAKETYKSVRRVSH